MHPYGTDSNERQYIPFILAGLAIAAAWLLFRVLDGLSIQIAWWIDAPSTMGFYGLFYTLFNRWIWRLELLHDLKLIKVPVLAGSWKGVISTSFDEHASAHDVEVEIIQTWTQISISLHGKDSKSHTLAATLLTDSPGGIVLSYQYRNEPLPHAISAMQMHYGTARLNLAKTGRLEGEYYSGRGRQNYGSVHLERKYSGLMQ
jgi:hypothetical protein